MAAELNYWKIFPRMPRKVSIGDITIRDGFQHEERFISTDAKIFYGQEMVLAGCREIEVTNLGNVRTTPQFRDAEDVFAAMRSEEFRTRCERSGIRIDEVVMTAVTIRETAVDRAVELRQQGIGPDRVLMMVSTDPEHHFANSGTTLSQYWREAERCIRKARDAGMKMCGTVSTIWGSPISGATDYYYKDPRYVGLICIEDLLVMIDELGIEHGYDVDRVLRLGALMEKTVGRRLRSEAVINGRTEKAGHPRFARPGLKKLIEKLGEEPGTRVPPEWPEQAEMPANWGPGVWRAPGNGA